MQYQLAMTKDHPEKHLSSKYQQLCSWGPLLWEGIYCKLLGGYGLRAPPLQMGPAVGKSIGKPFTYGDIFANQNTMHCNGVGWFSCFIAWFQTGYKKGTCWLRCHAIPIGNVQRSPRQASLYQISAALLLVSPALGRLDTAWATVIDESGRNCLSLRLPDFALVSWSPKLPCKGPD